MWLRLVPAHVPPGKCDGMGFWVYKNDIPFNVRKDKNGKQLDERDLYKRQIMEQFRIATMRARKPKNLE